MADNFDTDPASGGVTFASDDIGGVHHQRVKIGHGVDGTATDTSSVNPLPVAPQVQSPQSEQLTSTSLSAGGNADLTASDITGSTTGKLLALDFGATVPLKVNIQIVSGGRTTFTTVFSRAGQSGRWETPHPDFITQAGGAGNAFGVSITNLDTSESADVYATPYWDEV